MTPPSNSSSTSVSTPLGSPPPRIGTTRNLDYPSRGWQVAKIAQVIGTPLMPWQQHVADVALEYDPDTGENRYRELCLLVPRQSGKTTLLLSLIVHRALAFGKPQLSHYTAQTGDDAKEKWKEHVELLGNTPLRRFFTTNDTNGRQAIEWVNGSKYRPKAPTVKGGHGKTLHQGIIDEAFSQIDSRVQQAMRPAMITQPNAQFIVVSTAGDATSLFLNRKIETNRARLETEPDAPAKVAYFEWSAPEGAAIDDEEVWWQCMPALGRTIRPDEIRAELESDMTEREFRRAYYNQTDKGAAAEQILDPEIWLDTIDDNSRVNGRVTFAVDVAPDRSWATIAFAGTNHQGLDHVGLAKHDRGTSWIVEDLVAIMRRNNASTVYVQAGRQAAMLTQDLERAGLQVVAFNLADTAAACAGFYDAVQNNTLRRRPGQPALDEALAGTVWSRGETRVFDRGNSTTNISPLYAAALARWGHFIAAQESVDILATIA